MQLDKCWQQNMLVCADACSQERVRLTCRTRRLKGRLVWSPVWYKMHPGAPYMGHHKLAAQRLGTLPSKLCHKLVDAAVGGPKPNPLVVVV